MKTHQAKKVNQQQQSEDSPLIVAQNDLGLDSEQTELAINESVNETNSELVVQGQQI